MVGAGRFKFFIGCIIRQLADLVQRLNLAQQFQRREEILRRRPEFHQKFHAGFQTIQTPSRKFVMA
jgi:hypothetical protein